MVFYRHLRGIGSGRRETRLSISKKTEKHKYHGWKKWLFFKEYDVKKGKYRQQGSVQKED